MVRRSGGANGEPEEELGPPTSNLRTRAVPSLAAHPAAQLLQEGAQVTLNSDDPGLFAITLSGELELATQEMGFNLALIEQANQNALKGSFVKPETLSGFLAR